MEWDIRAQCSILSFPPGEWNESPKAAMFPHASWMIPMFRADFLRFALKSVEVWPNLLQDQ